MEPIVIEKEKNTLTITVNGREWTVVNKIHSGKFAGRTLTSRNRTNSKARAIGQAQARARLSGWNG